MSLTLTAKQNLLNKTIDFCNIVSYNDVYTYTEFSKEPVTLACTIL